jgi:hypothetical protein
VGRQDRAAGQRRQGRAGARERRAARRAQDERIVTDKGYGLREEIEALRENRAQDAGVPLDLPNKERA